MNRRVVYTGMAFMMSAVLTLAPLGVSAQDKPYYAGGSTPFPEDSKAILDQHSNILTLGINSDWFAAANLDSTPYIQAIDHVAMAVNKEIIPGAVLFVDRGKAANYPTGIGYRMTDPNKVPTEATTAYFLHDLTGPLVVVPLVYTAIMEERLSLDDPLEKHLVLFQDKPIGAITIEQCLRHASGLPGEIPDWEPMSERIELGAVLVALEPVEPGTKTVASPLNFMLLGLTLEAIYGEKLTEIAGDKLLTVADWSDNLLVKSNSARRETAPDGYSQKLGRMAWMEPEDSAGLLLGDDAGHTGLTLNADQVGGLCGAYMAMMAMSLTPDGTVLNPFGNAAKTDPSLPGGDAMGAGFMVGRFGPRSFGWDSPHGSSFWVLQDKFGYLIYLSNADHPGGMIAVEDDPRTIVLPLLAESIRGL